MEFRNIKVEDRESVRIIRISKESPLNPLDIETLKEIGEAVTASGNRVVVITGENKAFSAGANIKNFVDMEPETAFRFATEGHDIMNSIASHGMPVIAAIHGYALGGGFELALACDFRIAAPGSKLGLPEVTLGILPGFGGTQRLKQLVGEGKALELVSTGKTITAEEAEKLGIIMKVAEDYLGEALKFADELASKAPVALGYIKNLVRARPDNIFEDEKEKFALLFETEDRKEGINAFIEKRKPAFKGR